jgi:hypothetical protein
MKPLVRLLTILTLAGCAFLVLGDPPQGVKATAAGLREYTRTVRKVCLAVPLLPLMTGPAWKASVRTLKTPACGSVTNSP